MAAHWFSDVDLEGPSLLPQLQGTCLCQFTEQHIADVFSQNQNQELQLSISSESNSGTGTGTGPSKLCLCTPLNIPERPEKIAKSTTSWDSGITDQSSSSTMILSFGSNQEMHAGFIGGAKQPKKEVEMALPGIIGDIGGGTTTGAKRGYVHEYAAMAGGEGTRKGGNHAGSCNQDHILAERKRREKLSQRFIALSKIVPGLKKMDKASVLGDTIKYLKQLQDKVQDLEVRAAKRTIESAVIVKKSHLLPNYEDLDCNNHGSTLKGLPEIEAKISERTVLIKIHCENHKGALVNVLAEIEVLGLSITSTNVTPFAGTSLDITVSAQVGEEFSMNMKDVVKKLNQAFRQFM